MLHRVLVESIWHISGIANRKHVLVPESVKNVRVPYTLHDAIAGIWTYALLCKEENWAKSEKDNEVLD